MNEPNSFKCTDKINEKTGQFTSENHFSTMVTQLMSTFFIKNDTKNRKRLCFPTKMHHWVHVWRLYNLNAVYKLIFFLKFYNHLRYIAWQAAHETLITYTYTVSVSVFSSLFYKRTDKQPNTRTKLDYHTNHLVDILFFVVCYQLIIFSSILCSHSHIMFSYFVLFLLHILQLHWYWSF